MDIGDLIILLLFLFPVLSRLFGKKQPQQKRKRPVPVSERPDRPQRTEMEDPLAEALRQIREALGETEPEPEPEVSTVERPLEAPPEFREVGEFEHDEHGFGRSNPLSEEVFEDRPAYREMQDTSRLRASTDRIKQNALKSVDLTTPIEVNRSLGTEFTESTADALRDPKRAREAFIMKEVLGPPRSKQSLR